MVIHKEVSRCSARLFQRCKACCKWNDLLLTQIHIPNTNGKIRAPSSKHRRHAREFTNQLNL